MGKISVVIITFNEEQMIEDCLKSVDWAHEQIVVDSFSTDRTLEIVRKYTDKVIEQEWLGFGAQRDLGIAKCTGEWILVLDADERITPELRAELEELVAKDDQQFAGYSIPRKNYFLGRWIKHCQWYPDYTLRFFRRGKGSYNRQLVHEELLVDGKIGYTKEPLIHHTFRSLEHYMDKINHYTTLAAEDLVRKGRKATWTDYTFRPFWTFFKIYFLKKGFKDGIQGLIVSLLLAFYNFAKYVKIWAREKRNEKSV